MPLFNGNLALSEGNMIRFTQKYSSRKLRGKFNSLEVNFYTFVSQQFSQVSYLNDLIVLLSTFTYILF